MWEWDDDKRQRNLMERGIDFASVLRFDLGKAEIRPDQRRDYGELRLRAVGMLDGRLHVLIFTPRGDGLRVISLRRANARERRAMEKEKTTGDTPSGFGEDPVPFRRLAPDEPDEENPEWTAEDFAAAKPVWEFPDLVKTLQKHGYLGRPPMPPEQRKQRVTLHLDPDILAALRADGKGWQTRANAALRRALGLDA